MSHLSLHKQCSNHTYIPFLPVSGSYKAWMQFLHFCFSNLPHVHIRKFEITQAQKLTLTFIITLTPFCSHVHSSATQDECQVHAHLKFFFNAWHCILRTGINYDKVQFRPFSFPENILKLTHIHNNSRARGLLCADICINTFKL